MHWCSDGRIRANVRAALCRRVRCVGDMLCTDVQMHMCTRACTGECARMHLKMMYTYAGLHAHKRIPASLSCSCRPSRRLYRRLARHEGRTRLRARQCHIVSHPVHGHGASKSQPWRKWMPHGASASGAEVMGQPNERQQRPVRLGHVLRGRGVGSTRKPRTRGELGQPRVGQFGYPCCGDGRRGCKGHRGGAADAALKLVPASACEQSTEPDVDTAAYGHR